MLAQGPVLVGIEGIVEGEEFPLEYGDSVLIGRSRSCDICLMDCKKWQEMDPQTREKEMHFNTVSRKHVRVSFYNANSIEVEDFSSNGTFVDGKKIDRLLISDLRENNHEILLGTREKFRLEWRSR